MILLLGVAALAYLNVNPSNDAKWSWELRSALMVVLVLISLFTNLFTEKLGLRQSKILFSPEQFENCLDEILQKALKISTLDEKLSRWFRGGGYHDIDKLIIVVDNIDRCDAETAYSLLSDFKNFLGKENVVFIFPTMINHCVNI